jgi:hypothetical protein
LLFCHQEIPMKFTLARPSRPRNPMVGPSLFRQAGRHTDQRKPPRAIERRALQRELQSANRDAAETRRTRPDPHSP